MSQPATYFKKPETVQAFQYNGEQDLREPLEKTSSGRIEIETAKEFKTVNVGDWIVQDADGWEVYSPMEFAKHFQA